MMCSLCLSRPCNDGDSIGSRQGLCQDCWEAACSASWWDVVTALQGILPVESPHVTDPRCSGASDSASADRSVDVLPGR